jgi:glycosyltransferase involved in cell wall biosynthesis
MTARKRILVACEELILSGGMLRFERLGRALPADEYELAYVCLGDHPVVHWPTRFPVLSFPECTAQSWDFVMVPGAGFGDQTIDRLARFRDPRFGQRIQHILNDQSMKLRFLYVNRTFQPHLVIFNNLAWPPGSYTEFQAEQFRTVLGAVDIDRFCPTEKRSRERPGSTVLGGLANKNAEVLVDALALLPDNVSLKLLGNADALLDARPDVRHMPRVERVGVLFEDDLPRFYRDIDIAVHTEMRGGWSNFAAEAMASGVPLICTPHGTTAFARDGETATVLEKTSAPAISVVVERMLSDNARAADLARNATEAIRVFSWQMYIARLGRVLCLQR